MKTSFVNNLKKAFLSNPNDEKLKTGYANLQNQLKHVLEKTPDFVDPDDHKVSSTLTLDDFVKASFTIQLEEIIQEYDKMLTEACKSNVVEYEALFNSWLAWIKRLEIDLTGRTTPEWITFKSYSEAKKWCAKSNPAILSKDDIFLEELATLNMDLPTDPLKITPEIVFEAIEKIEKDASGADPEAIKKANEKVSSVKKNYTDLIASDKSKADVFSRLMAVSQAKSKASEIIAKHKSELNSLYEDSETFDLLLAKIQAAKNFDEISDIIIGKYVGDNLNSFKLSMMHLEVMAKYFEARNEDPSVVDSLKHLAENVDNKTLSPYECAEAWGNVILKMKDIGELKYYADSLEKADLSFEISRLNKFPYKLFQKDNEENFNKLRELHQEKTLKLLSAKSAADALEKICALDLNLSTGWELCKYFENVGNFSVDTTIGHIYHILPYSDSDNGKALLDHIKEIVKRTVTKCPPDLRVTLVDSYCEIPTKIAKCLERENHSPDELQNWADFGTDYEMIIGSGLEMNVANEKYFEAYRNLKNDFSDDNLTYFLTLILEEPEQFSDKCIASLLAFKCSSLIHGSILSNILDALWKINDARKVATNIMALRKEDDDPILDCMAYNGFNFSFLLNILDDVVLREICHKTFSSLVDLPDDFDFKHTTEFAEFVDSLKELILKISEYGYRDKAFNELRKEVESEKAKFAPSIGFLKPELKRYFLQESQNIIEAYKKLAVVIGDIKIKTLMNAEVKSIEQVFNNYQIV